MEEKINNKKDILDILRVLAMFLVIMVHLGQNLSFTSGGYIRSITELGKYGVEIFFVISGFLIVSSLKKSDTKSKFYIKKICRIIPTYYLVITISMLFHLFVFKDVPVDNTNLGFIRYYFMINTVIPSNNVFWINLCMTWSISVFLLFYLIFPFINKYVNNFKKSVIALIGSILFCKLFWFIYNLIILKLGISIENNFFPINYLYNFMFGVSTYYALKECKKDRLILILMLLLIGIVFSPLNEIPFIFCIVTSVIIMLAQEIKVKNKLSRKVLYILSDYSFDVYLSHALSFEVIRFIQGKMYINDFVYILLFTIFTICISYFVHFVSKKVIKSINYKRKI